LVFVSILLIKTLQVAIEVEREEDGGGSVGETFTDYVSLTVFIPIFSCLFAFSFKVGLAIIVYKCGLGSVWIECL